MLHTCLLLSSLWAAPAPAANVELLGRPCRAKNVLAGQSCAIAVTVASDWC